ncbi:MAG: adenylate/guanylate cyclase domain-containing protein, partial [Acidobacteriota bacterium]
MPTAPQEDLSRYLPEELLAKMRSARAGHAMQGERRTVTMLFADVTGSTAAAEQFDPEDWVEIMNGAFEHLIAPIYRYEGTLAQLRGDAILAFFGAPIAHEDDPVRALRAGLEMLEAVARYSKEVESRWGIPLQIRVGVNTGLVVVGEVGSDLRVEYTALGDAINVAARMEQTAEPGTVQVTEETLSRTAGAFETAELGGVEVKGKSEPVISHQVLRYTGELAGRDSTPMVGRAAELAQLDASIDTLASGSGLIVSVIAEAGIGKTRLLQEWRARSKERLALASNFDSDGDITFMFESSRSYDARDPFATVRNLLRRYWGTPDVGLEHDTVVAALSAVGLEDPDYAALLAYLTGASVPAEAEAFLSALETPILNAKAGEALLAYLKAAAASRPLMLVLEDLHWADDVSLALIEQVMGLTETSSVGLVVSMRPYREEPAWRIHEVAERNHHHRYHRISLKPLGRDDGVALLESLVGQTTLSDAERVSILERSDGNPFFLEEIAKSLAEADADSSLPSSLTGTLTARLDCLDEHSKYLVQVASVLGPEFERETLEVTLDKEPSLTQMTDLLRRGILVEVPDRPGALRFRHALFQEAAYQTILKRTRRELHKKIAGYLIEAHRDQPQEISAHLVEAGETSEAFPFLVEAGLKASRSMSLAEAIRLLSLALDHVPESAEPDAVEGAHDALGEAYSLVPDLSQASAAYQKLYEYGESHDRPAARVAALNRLGYTTATLAADLEGAMDYLEQARVLAEASGDDLGLAEYHMNACFVTSMA